MFTLTSSVFCIETVPTQLDCARSFVLHSLSLLCRSGPPVLIYFFHVVNECFSFVFLLGYVYHATSARSLGHGLQWDDQSIEHFRAMLMQYPFYCRRRLVFRIKKISLDSSIVGFPALIGLTEFSHIWLVFVFHDNTNAVVNGVADERHAPMALENDVGAGEAEGKGVIGSPNSNGSGGSRDGSEAVSGARRRALGLNGEAERWGGGVREYQPPKYKLRQTFLTKVW